MAKNIPIMEWKVGLCVKHKGKFQYLTAEKTGGMINASATAMKTKQLWTIEHDKTDTDVVYLRSPMGCYLSADKSGNASCSIREKTPETKFLLFYNPQGCWAFKNLVYGRYFGTDLASLPNAELHCKATSHGDGEWWFVRLAYHPQINLRSTGTRRAYAHYDQKSNQIHCKEDIPWGQNAQLTLEFVDGKYAVKTFDNKYLHRNGDLVDEAWQDALFVLELRSGQISGMALKDCKRQYLSAVGANGILKAKNTTIGKDELFRVEQCHPQVFFKANNGKYVSIKQGVDISANQPQVGDTETFQLEYATGRHWRVRTSLGKYWILSSNGLQREGDPRDQNTLFDIEYRDNGYVALKAANNKYASAAMNGSLSFGSASVGAKEQFEMVICNKQRLELRCEHGFVGLSTSNKVNCNQSNYTQFQLEASTNPEEKGEYYIKGPNDMYWKLDGKTLFCTAAKADRRPFRLVLRAQSKFAIFSRDSKGYIVGAQNGIMDAIVPIEKATLWEF